MSDFDADAELADLNPPPVGSQYHSGDTEAVLLDLRDMIDAARPVPLSASSMIAKDEVLALIDEALAGLPEELRAARWLLKEREEYLARVRHEGDALLDQARTQAEHMVQRTEVVKAAEQRAYQILDTAEVEARRLRHEVEDFCDQKLAGFEIVLERTMKLVTAGREKLQGTGFTARSGGSVDEIELPPPPGSSLPPPPGADLPPPPVGDDDDEYATGAPEVFDQEDL